MKELVFILGKSASGKSRVADMIDKNLRYEKVVPCTTRPKRKNELNGVDYYFIDEAVFGDKIAKDEFVYYSKYDTAEGAWYYGIERVELERHMYGVLVIEPDGFRALVEELDDHTTYKAFYIESDDRERYKRQIDRGDDIMEISLRAIRDNVAFMGIERDVFVVDGCKTVDETYRQIINGLL